MNYELIKSRRRTIGFEMKSDGTLVVRAPFKATKAEIEKLIISHAQWIEKARRRAASRKEMQENCQKLTREEILNLVKSATKYIPDRVAYYSKMVGVTYGRITLRQQKTRWGSCSSKGNLNFNYLLMLTPIEVIDSVIVHELCHRKEMNHSKRFYEEVLRVFPEYYKWDKWLKANGPAIMARAFE